MPKYFFDIHDGPTDGTDDDGTELDGLSAVREVALAALAEMAQDRVARGGYQLVMHVRDTEGGCVFRATLSLVTSYCAYKPDRVEVAD